MSEPSGTSYTAAVSLPDGITVETRVFVPKEAAYRDQHELAEVAQAGAGHMLGMVARTPYRPLPLDPWARCGAQWTDELPTDATPRRCTLDAGHTGEHTYEPF